MISQSIDRLLTDGRKETQVKQYICQFTPFTWRILKRQANKRKHWINI